MQEINETKQQPNPWDTYVKKKLEENSWKVNFQ